MRAIEPLLFLLLGTAYGVVVEGPSTTARFEKVAEDHAIGTLENHGGWVNPEDLIPMPQCIAQQDQAAWLNVLTKCTSKICTSHFGPLICTRHEWLTQLSCLSVGFSPDVIRDYLPHCSRLILAKAQLANWIQNITGRTWLVDVGDTLGLQHLSPDTLTKGYAAVNVVQKAPACWTESKLGPHREPLTHAIASCSFTDTLRHTGNSARPWEYSEPLRSTIALDSVTAGYDSTGRSIPTGDYFDKTCFCGILERGSSHRIFPEPDLSLTKQRLWINATCGSAFLSQNWKEGIKTTEFDYMPIETWRWPKCFADMPNSVTQNIDRCADDACEVDKDGYCSVKRAINRSCFCSNIAYETCEGSCHVFEGRIDYIHWLHSLCGNVDGWDGLPQDWKRLAVPTIADLIPTPWMYKSNEGVPETSAPFAFKLACLLMLNATPFLALFVSTKLSLCISPDDGDAEQRFVAGSLVAAFNMLATVLSAFFGRHTSFDDSPAYQMVLLWCTVPRLTWLASLLVITKRAEVEVSAISATLATEWVFQAFASCTMLQTVYHGLEHHFYDRVMERLNNSIPGKLMYAGALVWTITAITALVLLVHTVFRRVSNTDAMTTRNNKFKTAKKPGNKTMTKLRSALNEQWAHVTRLMHCFNQYWSIFEQHVYDFLTKKHHTPEQERLISHLSEAYNTPYGTLPSSVPRLAPLQPLPVRLYSISIASLLLLWVAQWMFWGGFLGLLAGIR